MRHWFSAEQALADYEREINDLPTFVARSGVSVIGFVTLKQHFPRSGEMYVMGVMAEQHRQGIGRRLLVRAEDWLRSQGVEYVHVKTLGPSRPDEGYERARAFYGALGYCPPEELRTLWDESNPALVLVKKL